MRVLNALALAFQRIVAGLGVAGGVDEAARHKDCDGDTEDRQQHVHPDLQRGGVGQAGRPAVLGAGLVRAGWRAVHPADVVTQGDVGEHLTQVSHVH